MKKDIKDVLIGGILSGILGGTTVTLIFGGIIWIFWGHSYFIKGIFLLTGGILLLGLVGYIFYKYRKELS